MKRFVQLSQLFKQSHSFKPSHAVFCQRKFSSLPSSIPEAVVSPVAETEAEEVEMTNSGISDPSINRKEKNATTKKFTKKNQNCSLTDSISVILNEVDNLPKFNNSVVSFDSLSDMEYSVSPAIMEELVRISGGILKNGLSKMIMLHHPEVHSLILLEKVAKYLASKHKADFLAIDISELADIMDHLIPIKENLSAKIVKEKVSYPNFIKTGDSSLQTHSSIWSPLVIDLSSSGTKNSEASPKEEPGMSLGNLVFQFIMKAFKDSTNPRIIFFEGLDQIFQFPPGLKKDWKDDFTSSLEKWNSGSSNAKVLIIGSSSVNKDETLEDAYWEEIDDKKEESAWKNIVQRIAEFNRGSAPQTGPWLDIEVNSSENDAEVFEAQVEADKKLYYFRANYKNILREMKLLNLKHRLPSFEVMEEKEKSKICEFDEIARHKEIVKICCIANSFEGSKIELKDLESALQIYNASKQHQPVEFDEVDKLKTNFKFDGNLNSYEQKLRPCIITPDAIKVSFKDIGSLKKTKDLLHELISWPLKHPEFFGTGILKDAVTGVLMFGPPGTGKTMLAKAVAAESGANFININMSNIFDMYVGEGEKNVKAIFSLARKLEPCVIFIDEIDALLSVRTERNSSGKVEVINEFMAQWDGLCSSSNDRILVLGATNRPFALDNAVLRRLPRRVLVDLPCLDGRLDILEILLKTETLASDLDLKEIAQTSENYSGSDLKNLCMAAALNSVRRCLESKEKHRILTKQDFLKAKEEISPSISDLTSTVNELHEWNKVYGQNKRKQKIFGF